MRKPSAFFPALGCLLALAFLVVIPALAMWKIWNELRTYCSHEVLVQLPSPTGAWTAIVSDNITDRPLDISINADVELISRERPNTSTKLLDIEIQREDEMRPRIAWSAPNVLRVTVPNIAYLKVLTRQADGVQVDIQFVPDDPAARAAWLKQTGQSPDKP